jgi:hypothetical protein
MKNNLEYYQRRADSYRHSKIIFLNVEYGDGNSGLAAEARYWRLLDLIAESDNCELDLTKKREKAQVSKILGLSFAKLDKLLSVLVSDDLRLLIEVRENVYSAEKLRKVFQEVSKLREAARVRKNGQNKGVQRTNTEPDGSSGELLTGSDELNNKVKGKVKVKVNESSSCSSSSKEISGNNNNDNFDSPNFENKKSLSQAFTNLIQRKFGECPTGTLTTLLKKFNSSGLSPVTAWQIVLDSFDEIDLQPAEKRNAAYLVGKMKGKFDDARAALREQESKDQKKKDARERREEEKKISEEYRLAKLHGGGPLSDFKKLTEDSQTKGCIN